MSRLLILSVVLVILWVPCSIAQAQQSRAPAETREDRLVQTEDGFSIVLAGGFQLGRRQEGYFLLGSNTVPGLILVKPMPGLDEAELRHGVETGYKDARVQLTPDGEESELEVAGGTGSVVEVSGFLSKTKVHGLLAGYLRPEGGGLLLFAVTAPEQWPTLQPVAEQMARSVNLFEADPEELIWIWKERLSGYQLTKAPGNPPRDDDVRKSYSVCSDGTFFDAAPNAGAPDAPSGTWKITAEHGRASLKFAFRDGREQSYGLYREELETYLDDGRYFVVPDKRCR